MPPVRVHLLNAGKDAREKVAHGGSVGTHLILARKPIAALVLGRVAIGFLLGGVLAVERSQSIIEKTEISISSRESMFSLGVRGSTGKS
jgi:hypothetical protein